MEAVLVALIGGAFTIVAILVEKGRKENQRDHNNVMDRLDLVSSEIRKDIRQVRYDLTDHVNGPAHPPAPAPAKVVRKRPKAG
jgi:hypothetical protein